MDTELGLRGVEHPELVFGLVGALGSPMARVVDILKTKLAEVSYDAEEIVLSNFLMGYKRLPTPSPDESDPPAKKLNQKMSRGNELRNAVNRGDVLAMHAAVEISKHRNGTTESGALEKRAFILRQLKNPDEVKLLRQIYGDGFHLIGVYTPEQIRSEYLRNAMGIDARSASDLIKRDAGEEHRFGQHVTATFYLADLIIETKGWNDSSIVAAEAQVARYIDLLFGRKIFTPSLDEYGMFLANSASLRSSDLSRQVGAAILTETGEVISLGTNEVPRAGGGQYWGESGDRDFEKGYDSNEKWKLECVREVLEHIQGEEWKRLSPQEQQENIAAFAGQLADTRLMNLTEFGRAVHAEMEAVMSAARMGISVRGKVLYTTTFPCHNCAKHIVGAGLSRLVYVEPYSKSLADRLHGDSIAFSLDTQQDWKILFEPFHGVTPRRFSELFSMVDKDGTRMRRKVPGGNVKLTPGLRTVVSPLTHIDREAMVATFLDHTMTQLGLKEETQ